MKLRLQLQPFLFLGPLLLTGCYTPQQDHYKAEMSAVASNGMSAQALVNALNGKGFACSQSADALPKYDCSRTKQNLFPTYSCVERVRFVDVAGTAGNVDIPPVACAGL